MLAGDSPNVAGPKVTGFCNLAGGGPRAAPEKQIEKGNFNALFVAGHIFQLTDRRGSIRSGVESRAARKIR
jgi:hypothetical protein